VTTFRALHDGPGPLLLPNAWDRGSARVLAAMGFRALATTSSGHARSLGRLDRSVTRDEAIAHARDLTRAVDVPVSADLEDCFAPDPEGVAETVRLAVDAGLAGCSIEDSTRDDDRPVRELPEAIERVAAAADAARGADHDFVLTARAELPVRGSRDLDVTIERLRAYRAAGADVLYAPAVTDADHIRAVVAAVDAPVNVLARAQTPPVAQLAGLGVRRVSVGGAFQAAALGALVDAGRELLEAGTYSYLDRAIAALQIAHPAFAGRD